MLNRFNDRPPALGQVVVIPFREKPGEFSSLSALQTTLIIKPDGWDVAYYKFCGGMLREGESFETAALRELNEETGIKGDKELLSELCRIKKRQHSPHTGRFDVVVYLAFGCDFTRLKDPLYREVGDEGEEALLASFADIVTPDYRWKIPTRSSQTASLFAQHFGFAEDAVRIFGQKETTT
ncbi:NUDIX hydrolase [Candidatus Kaiserbacteria bacterium]|nr:NUDIX hydrolase [Candidatus Kaiserbacteria bacterium]